MQQTKQVRCVTKGHKAPSAKRCIKTGSQEDAHRARYTRHKAPSAKRCIKTEGDVMVTTGRWEVIKHRAPNGALRQDTTRGVLGNGGDRS